MPGATGMIGLFLHPEGRWWECPAGCRIWFGVSMAGALSRLSRHSAAIAL